MPDSRLPLLRPRRPPLREAPDVLREGRQAGVVVAGVLGSPPPHPHPRPALQARTSLGRGLRAHYTHITHTSLCLALSPSEKSVYSELTLSFGNEARTGPNK
ncbi:hypothetical protein C7M84_001750 [Penaeus vannamei]|uniref:Uncharacterized protein n=1 Tax=Penaeus vannamei TaxID=6689 RepID=A0A3R7MKZ3_PENVA|nr:hypothetical protein C7M84_001750 [Penaeus vannamei]